MIVLAKIVPQQSVRNYTSAVRQVFEIAQPVHQREPGWLLRAMLVYQRNMEIDAVLQEQLAECRRILRGTRHTVTKGLPAPNVTVRQQEMRKK